MEILSEKNIDKLARRYPVHSQDDKGLNTFVSYKLYQPDRRGNGDGFWFITECERIGDEVQFTAISGNEARPQSAKPVPFLLSILTRWANANSQVIELDRNFKPGTLQELYDTEPLLQGYIDGLKEEQRRRDIVDGRDVISDTVYQCFAGLDNDGVTARKIADALVDNVISEMVNHRLDVNAAVIRALAMRLGIIKLNVHTAV